VKGYLKNKKEVVKLCIKEVVERLVQARVISEEDIPFKEEE
jgi:hypothetical protein